MKRMATSSSTIALTTCPFRDFFRELADRERPTMGGLEGGLARPASSARSSEPAALRTKSPLTRVPPAESVAVLRSATEHPDVLPGFDRRVEQETMVSAVGRCSRETAG